MLIADRISEKTIMESEIGAIQQNYQVSTDKSSKASVDELRTKHDELARAFAELKASVDSRSAVDKILDSRAKFWLLALVAVVIAFWDFCVELRNSRISANRESRTSQRS